MRRRIDRYRYLSISIVVACIFAFLLFALCIHAQSKYRETIAVLRALYQDEVQAFKNYQAYTKKAASENYPNIAKLFISIATSESIHARNFKRILSDIGVEAQEIPGFEPEVSSTRKNLKLATAVELEEIDNKYPQFIKQITPENHAEAIQCINYAWKAEKQHRELLKKIKSGTGIFFGVLTQKIEGSPSPYFVCQNCGSTLSEMPEATCPICGGPSAKYTEIR
ncbi:MAG: ferritin family protein [Desulfobacterales bacterium]|jgi:rubrerythrin